MTTDDIIAVIERGMCHSADKAAECDVCARKRAAIAEVRTGREQLLAALAEVERRDAALSAADEVVRLISIGATTRDVVRAIGEYQARRAVTGEERSHG